MGLSVQINYQTKIKELSSRYKELNFLDGITLQESNSISWNRNGTTTYDLQVIFIGKTGYGKSSTLNSIIGKNVFETSDVEACTKALYSAEYHMNDYKPYYFSLCDLPGVGESKEADKQYYEWYRDILLKSHCVVYILRADQRDFAIDEILFKEMFKNNEEKKKVIIALNFADKVEPINRNKEFLLTSQQIENINRKVDTISRLFGMSKDNIIYYSAAENFNINNLISKVSKVIRRNI